MIIDEILNWMDLDPFFPYGDIVYTSFEPFNASAIRKRDFFFDLLQKKKRGDYVTVKPAFKSKQKQWLKSLAPEVDSLQFLLELINK